MTIIPLRTALALLLAVLLAGCGGLSKKVDEMEDPNTAFVFGYMDMDEAPTHLAHFWLRQGGPKADKKCCTMRINDGMFYREGIKPAPYQFEEFGGPGGMFSNVSYWTFSFPRQTDGFRIDRPGVYYVGSYKYKKAGTFWNPKFDVETTKKPGEKELLEKILPYTAGTKWEARLRARLKELK